MKLQSRVTHWDEDAASPTTVWYWSDRPAVQYESRAMAYKMRFVWSKS